MCSFFIIIYFYYYLFFDFYLFFDYYFLNTILTKTKKEEFITTN
jgi:hypothetical protein